MSTGRMETMEPPESTSGTTGLDPGDFDDLSELAGPPEAPLVALPEPTEVPDSDIAAPPVVAIVVTAGAGPWLEAALASLAAQDYPALSVLVLDNAADEDPTARIAAQLPAAFVRRLPENVGFAAAANEALHSVEGATFLFFCHDDVVLDPDAVRVMVEEAYRSNAGIVGPKLVDYEHPEVLLEVGMTVDHYAVPFSAIEPGEIDQEQHDGVRDVFFVSHASMLARADLFKELGGFDVGTSPGSDDIDLCWRARLVGARVLVVPASRVRHRLATAVDERRTRRQSPHEARAATRARVRLLSKSYSTVALWWVLPSGFVLSLGEAVGLTLTGRWRHAAAVVAGWFPHRGSMADLRSARATTQSMRSVDDADIRDLMVRGSARFRSLLVQRLHAGDRLADASSRARARMAHTSEQLRRVPAILAVVVALLLVIGSRALVFQRVPEIGGFQSWPGVGSLWSTFTSPWRYTMVGARVPATPAFAMMSALSTVLFGHDSLARTVVVVGAMPLGILGAFRLVRTLSASVLPGVVAATAYAANPIGRDAVARGDLGPLVCYAVAPFVLLALVRAIPGHAVRADRDAARHAEDPSWRTSVRAIAVVGVLGAIAGAVWPPAILLPLLLAFSFAFSTLFVWGDWAILRAAGLAVLGFAASVLLLSPWVWSLIGADAATLGLRPRPPLSVADLLKFDVGPAHAGWFTFGLVVIAAVPLVIASGPRLAWATRAWLLILVSFAVTWLPARISVSAPVAAPEGMLIPAALGVAVAAGMGVSALLDDMRRSRFGWRQVAAVAAVVGLALPLLALAVDTASGRWQLPSTDWPTAMAWMKDVPSRGGFRVLWLGDPATLPVDSKLLDGGDRVGFGLTRDGGGDARTLWAAPAHAADDGLARALDVARNGDTARLGHLLAPLGVRYVASVNRVAPDHGAVVVADPKLNDALARQLDLSVSRIDDGAIVYENDAWIPRRAIVPADTPVHASSGSGFQVAASSAAAARARGVGGPIDKSQPTGPGTLLWSEAADRGWHANAPGLELVRSRAFAWTNAFAVPARARVGIDYRAGRLPGVLIVLELLAWAIVLEIWRHTRIRRRRARGTNA